MWNAGERVNLGGPEGVQMPPPLKFRSSMLMRLRLPQSSLDISTLSFLTGHPFWDEDV